MKKKLIIYLSLPLSTVCSQPDQTTLSANQLDHATTGKMTIQALRTALTTTKNQNEKKIYAQNYLERFEAEEEKILSNSTSSKNPRQTLEDQYPPVITAFLEDPCQPLIHALKESRNTALDETHLILLTHNLQILTRDIITYYTRNGSITTWMRPDASKNFRISSNPTAEQSLNSLCTIACLLSQDCKKTTLTRSSLQKIAKNLTSTLEALRITASLEISCDEAIKSISEQNDECLLL